MNAGRIALSPAISNAYAEELEKRLYFIAAEIERFKLVVEGECITAIDLETPENEDLQALAAKINRVIAGEITTQKLLPGKVVWQHDAHGDYDDTIFEQLCQRCWLTQAGEGQMAIGGPLIWLMDTLDEHVKAIATSLGASEYRYPTLIPTKALEDCGYFDAFPHMLMFVTRLHNDVDIYQKFAEQFKAAGGLGTFALNHCDNVDYCLPPTMCYHTYHQLRDQQLPGNQVITAKGKSFRFESKYHRTMERLWDFTIREIVFLGEKDFVIDCRHTYMQAAFALMEKLGLTGYCEVASDPFFCSPDTAARIFSQKMRELKYELRLNVAANRTIAVGSFNFHDQTFGERFKITRSDQDWIRTGCVGFGLERLLYAFVCQHGLDEKRWQRVLAL
ncbi:MAG: hypothetical protein ACOYYS_10715 [Chloroflexota bacterium]